MGQHIRFLRYKIFKVWLLYLVTGLAFIPAGIICFVLLRWGISRPLSFFVSLSVGSCLAYFTWKSTDKQTGSVKIISRRPHKASSYNPQRNAKAMLGSGTPTSNESFLLWLRRSSFTKAGVLWGSPVIGLAFLV